MASSPFTNKNHPGPGEHTPRTSRGATSEGKNAPWGPLILGPDSAVRSPEDAGAQDHGTAAPPAGPTVPPAERDAPKGILLVGVTPGGFEKWFEERQGVDAETNRALMKAHHMEVVGPPLK